MDEEQNSFYVTLKTVRGLSIKVTCEIDDTIEIFKKKVLQQTGEEPSWALVVGGKMLKPDSQKLADFEVVKGSNVHQVYTGCFSVGG